MCKCPKSHSNTKKRTEPTVSGSRTVVGLKTEEREGSGGTLSYWLVTLCQALKALQTSHFTLSTLHSRHEDRLRNGGTESKY